MKLYYFKATHFSEHKIASVNAFIKEFDNNEKDIIFSSFCAVLCF